MPREMHPDSVVGCHRQLAVQDDRLRTVNCDAAGIDIGATVHFVAVPKGRDEVSVRNFGTYTADLEGIADLLAQCGVTTVAMESTGVYWIPLYELLEHRGFEVILSEPSQIKKVPGRKSDVLDCQWIQRLHSFGLLRGSFVQMMRSLCYEPISDNGKRSWVTPPATFSTCRKP